jgi:hypothetical protein
MSFVASAEVTIGRRRKSLLMFGFGPFPTAPTVSGVCYENVIDSVTAWTLVLTVLVVCCSGLWTLGSLRRTPDDDGRRRSSIEDVEKEAA